MTGVASERLECKAGQSVRWKTGTGPWLQGVADKDSDVRGFSTSARGRVRWMDVTEFQIVAAVPIGNGSTAAVTDLAGAAAHSGGIARPAESIASIPLDDIEPSKLNPRKRFDEAALKELAESIEQHGLIQPIVLKSTPGARSRYSIVAGERRYRAHRLLGKTEISAVVRRGLEDTDHIELALVENLMRSDISAIEEAEGYQQLIDEGKSQSYIARRVGRSQPHIANTVKLLKLPADVQEEVRTGAISGTAGENLARFAEFPAVTAVYLKLLKNKQIKASDLEKGVPFHHELVRANAVVELHDWHFPFVKTVCQKQCPFNAYRKEGYVGICLRPSHVKELQLEHEKQQRQQTEAKAKAKAAGIENPDKLPVIGQTLRYGDYERLSPGRTLPKGCSKQCACRALALDSDGSVVTICDKPRRFNQLRNAEEREIKAKKRAKFETRFNSVLESFGNRERLECAAAIVVAEIVCGSDKPVVSAAAKAIGIDFEAPKENLKYRGDRTAVFTQLAQHPAEVLLTLGGAILLEREVSNAASWGADTRALDWLCPVQTSTPEPEDRVKLICEKCGGECTVENAGVVVGVEHDEIGERGIVWCVKCRDEARAAAPADELDREAVAA